MGIEESLPIFPPACMDEIFVPQIFCLVLMIAQKIYTKYFCNIRLDEIIVQQKISAMWYTDVITASSWLLLLTEQNVIVMNSYSEGGYYTCQA